MKTFIKKLLTIYLLYINTVVLTYLVQHAWYHENTHVFYARLCIFIPIAIASFIVGTYLLINLIKYTTYKIKKKLYVCEREKRLAEKHRRWQSYFDSVDRGYYVIDNREIYDSNDVLIGVIIK